MRAIKEEAEDADENQEKGVVMIKKIEHIGVAVKNLNEAEKFYSESLSIDILDREVHGDMKVSFLCIGETSIELLEGLAPDSVIAKFIEKRGEGIHHIAFEVDDIDRALETLKKQGVSLIDQKPRSGAHNSRVAFLNPKAAHGILLELVEPAKK